jgi:hypothetical protein
LLLRFFVCFSAFLLLCFSVFCVFFSPTAWANGVFSPE